MKEKEIFITLIDQNRNLIYKICQSYCPTADERKDLEQEIYIQIWNSFSKYDGRLNVSIWLYRIVLNTAISYCRSNFRHTSKKAEPDSMVISEFTKPEFEKDKNTRFLHEFIIQLNELDKALILLYLDDHSDKDIAEIMGISEKNVATKLSRIQQHIRTQIKHL